MITDLGELALPLAQSTDPQLRAAVILRLDQLHPSPGHLNAALAMLNEEDPRVLATVRRVLLKNLAQAAPSKHLSEVAKALAHRPVTRWEEGDLAFGAYLQASGEVEQAGDLFAAAIASTEGQASVVRDELINRLALNLLLRFKLPAASDAIAGLEAATAAEVCALSIFEVRVGVLPRCRRQISSRVQAEELRRALTAAEAQ